MRRRLQRLPACPACPAFFRAFFGVPRLHPLGALYIRIIVGEEDSRINRGFFFISGEQEILWQTHARIDSSFVYPRHADQYAQGWFLFWRRSWVQTRPKNYHARCMSIATAKRTTATITLIKSRLNNGFTGKTCVFSRAAHLWMSTPSPAISAAIFSISRRLR